MVRVLKRRKAVVMVMVMVRFRSCTPESVPTLREGKEGRLIVLGRGIGKVRDDRSCFIFFLFPLSNLRSAGYGRC